MTETFKSDDAHREATAARLTLLRNGWKPIPLCEKRPFQPEWNTKPVDERAIHSWPAKAVRMTEDGTRMGVPAVTTGIQLQGNTFVIDVDSDDLVLCDAIYEAICDTLGPAMTQQLPVRHSQRDKFMAMMQTETPFDTWRTLKYDDGSDTHQIEAFGGGALARQFAVDGPHTLGEIENGEYPVLRRYEWESSGPNPFDITPDDLPRITDAEARELLGAIDSRIRLRATHQGWEQVSRNHGHVQSGTRAFDLDISVDFETKRFGTCSYEDLCGLAEHERLAANGWGETGGNTTRCSLVKIERDGVELAGIFDFEDHVTHWPEGTEDFFTPVNSNDLANELGEMLPESFRERAARRALEISTEFQQAWEEGADTLEFEAAMEWLMGSLAFDVTTSRLRWIDRPGLLWMPVKPDAVKAEVAHLDLQWEGPRGGMRRLSAYSVWLGSEHKIMVAGARFDPRETEEVYQGADGERYINGYRGLPDLGTAPSEDIQLIQEFLVHLVPDDEERQWLVQYLADKYRHPWKRNCMVLFVAAGVAGAGRGTLFSYLDRVFGGYTQHVGQDHLLNSKFNEHMERSLIIFCNEVGGIDWRSRKTAMEKLKDDFDPDHNLITVNPKGLPAYRAETFASGIFATNNANALPLDPEDRRVAVITNGEKLEGDLLRRLLEAGPDRMAAALATLIKTVKVDKNVNDAPMFAGREHMLAAGETDTDDAIRSIVENAPEWAAWVRSDFDSKVKLAVTGSTSGKVPGLRSAITDLHGVRAERMGATWLGNVWAGGQTKKIVAKNPIHFLSLTSEQRQDVLDGTEPEDDDTNVVPMTKRKRKENRKED